MVDSRRVGVVSTRPRNRSHDVDARDDEGAVWANIDSKNDIFHYPKASCEHFSLAHGHILQAFCSADDFEDNGGHGNFTAATIDLSKLFFVCIFPLFTRTPELEKAFARRHSYLEDIREKTTANGIPPDQVLSTEHGYIQCGYMRGCAAVRSEAVLISCGKQHTASVPWGKRRKSRVGSKAVSIFRSMFLGQKGKGGDSPM